MVIQVCTLQTADAYLVQQYIQVHTCRSQSTVHPAILNANGRSTVVHMRSGRPLINVGLSSETPCYRKRVLLRMGVLVPRCPSRSPRGVGGRGQVRCALRVEAVHTYIRNCVGCYIVRFHDTPIIPPRQRGFAEIITRRGQRLGDCSYATAADSHC